MQFCDRYLTFNFVYFYIITIILQYGHCHLNDCVIRSGDSLNELNRNHLYNLTVFYEHYKLTILCIYTHKSHRILLNLLYMQSWKLQTFFCSFSIFRFFIKRFFLNVFSAGFCNKLRRIINSNFMKNNWETAWCDMLYEIHTRNEEKKLFFTLHYLKSNVV